MVTCGRHPFCFLQEDVAATMNLHGMNNMTPSYDIRDTWRLTLTIIDLVDSNKPLPKTIPKTMLFLCCLQGLASRAVHNKMLKNDTRKLCDHMDNGCKSRQPTMVIEFFLFLFVFQFVLSGFVRISSY